jgi:hypothetical protein
MTQEINKLHEDVFDKEGPQQNEKYTFSLDQGNKKDPRKSSEHFEMEIKA